MTASVIGALRVNLGLDSAHFSSGLRGASKNMATFQGAMLGMAAKVAAALGGMMAVRAVGTMADDWSDLQSKVGAAIGSMDQAPAVMGRLVDLANASYSPLSQTADGFARNVGALRDLGLGTQQAIDYTEALNHALVITATRGDRAASVQDTLSKAMAVGKLQADGLETVLANGGRVAQALADELGTNVSGLRAMASQGKITGAVIAGALTGNLEALRAEAAEMPATMADGFTRIRNNLTAFVGQLDQALGASSAVASGLMWVGDNLSLIAGFASAAGVAIAAAYVPALWSAVTALAAAAAGTKIFGASLISLRGAIYATGIGVLIAGAGYLVGKFIDVVRATGSLGGAFALVKEVATEAFGRVGDAMLFLKLKAREIGLNIQASFVDMAAAIIDGGIWFINRYIGIYRGGYEAIVAVWDMLPAAAGEAVVLAANATLSGVTSMANKALEIISAMAQRMTSGLTADVLDLVPGGSFIKGLANITGSLAGGLAIDPPEIENPFEGALGDAGAVARDAFLNGFGADTVTTDITDAMRSSAADDRTMAELYGALAEIPWLSVTQPLESLDALRAAVSGVTDTVTDETIPALNELASGGSGKKGEADTWWRELVDGVLEAQMQRTADAIKRGADAMSGFLNSIVDGSKSAMEALGDLLKQIAQVYIKRAVLGFGQTGFGGSLLGSLGLALDANANGTHAFGGGWSRVHERGGEIMNLPRGTQIIPHDISKRMADAASKSAAAPSAEVIVRSDPGVIVEVARGVVRHESNAIVGQSVSAVQRGTRKTSKFLR